MALYTLKIRWGRWEDSPGGRRYVRYASGDQADLSPEEAVGFPPGRIEPVLVSGAPPGERSINLTATLEGNVPEVAERIAALGEVSPLLGLRLEEQNAEKPRKGVLRAIDARLVELGFTEQQSEGGSGETEATDDEEF